MVELLGYIVAWTNRAVLFQCHYWHGPEWLPRSQVDVQEFPDSTEVHVRVSPFVAKAKSINEVGERLNRSDDYGQG
jgi:hypothetical protein